MSKFGSLLITGGNTKNEKNNNNISSESGNKKLSIKDSEEIYKERVQETLKKIFGHENFR
jgi:hypothetical protein